MAGSEPPDFQSGNSKRGQYPYALLPAVRGKMFEFYSPDPALDLQVDYFGDEFSQYEDDEYSPTNRQRRREPKTGLFWCDGCDKNLVNDCNKCSVCGKRNSNIRRNKKPSPMS